MSENEEGRLSWEAPGRFETTRGLASTAEPAGAPDPRVIEELLSLCPPGYRDHPILRTHPRLLLRLARHHVEAELAILRGGYSDLRREMRDAIPHHAIVPALEMYRVEGTALHAALRRIDAIERSARAR